MNKYTIEIFFSEEDEGYIEKGLGDLLKKPEIVKSIKGAIEYRYPLPQPSFSSFG
jgi:hypothetical protein